MGLIVPAPQFSLYQSNVQAAPSSINYGTIVNNPTVTANTKATSFTQLIASTNFDAMYVAITVAQSGASNTDTSTLMDIAIGAAASETVIIPNLLVGYGSNLSNWTNGRTHFFPLYIPAGSRISARTQSVRTSGSQYVFIELWGGPRDPASAWAGSVVTDIGTNLADSGGVTVVAGNSGAEGSATAIGTTSMAHSALVVAAQGVGTYTASMFYFFDIGIDTSSTSWLVQDYVQIVMGSSEEMRWISYPPLPIYAPIPSGTVLVMAGEASGTANNLDFALYGVS